MKTSTRALALLAVLAVVLAAVVGCGNSADDEPLSIGYPDQPELAAAAGIYAAALSRTGRRAELAGQPAASEAALLDAAAAGEVDLFPAYTGRLLTLLSAAPEATGGEELLAEVSRALPQGVSIGDPTQVSDRPQLLIATSLRERYEVETLADCGRLPAGLPLVTVDRIDEQTLADFAGCRPGPVTRLPDAAAVLERVAAGEALGVLPALASAAVAAGGQEPGAAAGDEVQALTSDGAPRAQNLVPVYRSAMLSRGQLKSLSRIAGELSTADLAAAGTRVRAGEDPAVVGRDWVATHGA